MPLKQKNEIYLILDNIRSVHNVGSIFRTADCLGATKIFLVGTTPTPNDRFGRPRKDFAKVSLGAEKSVIWEYAGDLESVLKNLKSQNVAIVAFEQHKNSQDYRTIQVASSMALIFGNEVDGVSEKILEKCDAIAEIPMKGVKESLNVSVTVGIALANLNS